MTLPSSLQGLATRWLASLPGRESHPLDYATLPGRTQFINTRSHQRSLEEPYLRYVYDLGDDWIHLIEVENILPAEKGVAYPVCIGGKMNAPPDDSGGVWGYEEMLEILSDPSHEEYDETKEWIDSMTGGTFDPKHFDPAEVRFMDPKQRLKESLG